MSPEQEERNARIRELYKTTPLKELADRFNLTERQCRRIALEGGVRKQVHKSLGEEERRTVVQECLRGVSKTHLAKVYGVSPMTVAKYVKAAQSG